MPSHLNNLRMLANVRDALLRSSTSSTRFSTEGKVYPRLREIMYLRIAANYRRLLYEYRTNLLFAQEFGKSDQEIVAVLDENPVTALGAAGNLIANAAEEITADISTSHDTLKGLLEEFGTEGTSEIIRLVSWFNIIRYVGSTRVPYQPDPAKITSGGAPLALKS